MPTPSHTEPAHDASMHDMLRMMDVASALRRQRESAEDQLDLATQKRNLRERLLATATASGEALTPAEVDAAIDQYYQQKHRYEDPPRGWAKLWATLWIDRWRWLLALVVVAVVVLGSLALAHVLSESPKPEAQSRGSQSEGQEQPNPPPKASTTRQKRRQPAPRSGRSPHELLEQALADAEALANDDDARRRVAAIAASARAAEAAGDATVATSLHVRLAKLTNRLNEQYVVRIVVAPDERSGIFREYQGKISGHYLIVEAVDDDGRIVHRSIESSETGRTTRVRRWGERVPEAVYNQVGADKRDNGLIDQRTFARKQRGHFAEQIVFKTRSGKTLARTGAITQW